MTSFDNRLFRAHSINFYWPYSAVDILDCDDFGGYNSGDTPIKIVNSNSRTVC